VLGLHIWATNIGPDPHLVHSLHYADPRTPAVEYHFRILSAGKFVHRQSVTPRMDRIPGTPSLQYFDVELSSLYRLGRAPWHMYGLRMCWKTYFASKIHKGKEYLLSLHAPETLFNHFWLVVVNPNFLLLLFQGSSQRQSSLAVSAMTLFCNAISVPSTNRSKHASCPSA
jgi:hypothetical protein